MYKKIILVIITLVAMIAGLWYVKSTIIYHPMPVTSAKCHKFFGKLLQLTESKNHIMNTPVRTPDGISLDTVYIKNPDSARCIIFFHGNAGNLYMRFDMIKFLYNYASVVIFDYRSFGKSTGDKFMLQSGGLHLDAMTIWNFVTSELKISPNNISLFGESLGCAIAIYLAADLSKQMVSLYYPHSLILNSPFYSLVSMIEVTCDKIGMGFVGKLLRPFIGHEYQSNVWIEYINYTTKIIIAHSPGDEIVPYQEGLKLYKLVAGTHGRITFINITGTHNNLGLTDNYIYALARLFDE